jgi:uncharacterized protein (TIGR02757 family)
MLKGQTIRHILDQKYQQYNQKEFILLDPISIPRSFSKKQDIEISGLFAALFAWGQRPTIINKCRDLLERMDNAPYEFILGYEDKDLQKLLGFKHRTFNDTDLLYFVHFLRLHYSNFDSLETAFTRNQKFKGENVELALIQFREQFQGGYRVSTNNSQKANFGSNQTLNENSLFAPNRTMKHVSSPLQNSACKRLNMYLRWMVRKDNYGVDFGLWEGIYPKQLIIPLDLHVGRVARKLGLLEREQDDWKAAVLLTDTLKRFDPKDPVKYDFALFGMGIEKYF